jgi:hypothetical protein
MAEQLISNWIGVKLKVCKPITLLGKLKFNPTYQTPFTLTG